MANQQQPPSPEVIPERKVHQTQEHPDVDPRRDGYEPDSWRPSDAESSPTRVGHPPSEEES